MTSGERFHSNPDLKMSVVVLTLRRTQDLAKCLAGLEAQERPADEVIVVHREDDSETRDYLAARAMTHLPLRQVTVTVAGIIAARNAGLQAVQGDVLSFLDDDAVPRPDWLLKIAEHFRSHPRTGGLGGRDQCYRDGSPVPASAQVVGKLLWFGKHVGNHSLGLPLGPRRVDMLKGVNMSYRVTALQGIEFDRRLRGSGSADDLAFSRAVALAGWDLVYDPAVLVDHYEGVTQTLRHYASVQVTDFPGFEASVYNLVIATWDSLTLAGKAFSLVYFFLIGTRLVPGLVQAVRFTPALGWGSWLRFFHAQRARFSAVRDLMQERRTKSVAS